MRPVEATLENHRKEMPQCLLPSDNPFTDVVLQNLSILRFQNLQDSAGMQEEEIRIYELTDTVLKTIEEIACESAVAVPPENMLVTVCHTIASARGEKQKHEDELSPTTQGEKLDSEWTQLAGLLSGRNESDARLASSWLLSLLVAIADKEEYEGGKNLRIAFHAETIQNKNWSASTEYVKSSFGTCLLGIPVSKTTPQFWTLSWASSASLLQKFYSGKVVKALHSLPVYSDTHCSWHLFVYMLSALSNVSMCQWLANAIIQDKSEKKSNCKRIEYSEI